MESSLEYEVGAVRRKTVKVLRDLLAKHDCDPRYNEPVSVGGTMLVCVCVCVCVCVMLSMYKLQTHVRYRVHLHG